jgi:multidrug resistance efflux pump
MKLLSIIAGLVLLIVGGYVLIGEHLAGISIAATVNARITTLRAPIEGRLALRGANIGTRIAHNQTVASLADDRIDNTRLADLKYAEEGVKADLAKIQSQRDDLIQARETLSAHAANYRTGRIEQLGARLAEAKAVREAVLSRVREHGNALKRARELSERGVQTAANLDRAQSSEEIAQEDLKAATQRIAYLTIELEAARTDTFLGDSYNDAPYSLQRIRELDLRIAELNTDEGHLTAKLKQTQERVAEEIRRLNKLTAAELAAPADGLLWEYLANTGEVVRKGQDLVKLVDCTTVMITAAVNERLYNTLRQGDPAQFRLLGSSEVFDAVVTRLGGTGAAALYANLAIGPTPDHLKRYDVTLSAPMLARSTTTACAVGRTGRVVFSDSPLAAVRRTIAELAW